jgi:hypothetical protein
VGLAISPSRDAHGILGCCVERIIGADYLSVINHDPFSERFGFVFQSYHLALDLSLQQPMYHAFGFVFTEGNSSFAISVFLAALGSWWSSQAGRDGGRRSPVSHAN